MKFTWSVAKEKLNIKKHNINFSDAACVFDDPNRVERYDSKHSTPAEDRYNVIGFVHNLLFVVYTEVSDDTVRIISARRATKEESNGYYSNLYP